LFFLHGGLLAEGDLPAAALHKQLHEGPQKASEKWSNHYTATMTSG